MLFSKKIIALSMVALLSVVATPTAFALHSPEHYSLFGEAEYISPGNASNRAVSVTSDADPGYGGIAFDVEDNLTFADIEELSTDYRFESDDSCAGGSPRFQIGIETASGTKNIFAYLGDAPNYTNCVAGVWTDSGDLLETGMTVDTSQLPGGTFYDPYESALTKYGSSTVVSIELVADGSWAFNDSEQSVDFDNTTVDTTLFTYEIPVAMTAAECKNGGWQNLSDDDGNAFKNQGDCVSFVASKGKNKAS